MIPFLLGLQVIRLQGEPATDHDAHGYRIYNFVGKQGYDGQENASDCCGQQ